jgi:uncharacterized protein YjbI with pentapeptide repeats
MSERISYEESYRRLQERGHFPEKAVPPIRPQLPSIQDEAPVGISFFRTLVGEEEPGLMEDMANMTLPRTFFGRSYVRQVSFKGCDLSESCLCWNDFTEVDFTKANLSGSDLRASLFQSVLFVRADLSDADLRQSVYENCDFSGAAMRRTVLTHEQGEALMLSEQQRREIDWQQEDGEEPEGG